MIIADTSTHLASLIYKFNLHSTIILDTTIMHFDILSMFMYTKNYHTKILSLVCVACNGYNND